MKNYEHIDGSFYFVTGKEAGKLVRAQGRKLPRHGYESKVETRLGTAWLQRTMVAGKQVWAIQLFGNSDRISATVKLR